MSTTTTVWYQEIFETEAWHLIHDGFWKARNPSKHAKLIAERLGLESPSRVLDVPCGTGQISAALADLGHEVCGVDLSPSLLAKARVHAEDGSALTFVESDMRVLPKKQFDAAVCWWGSFGYLEDEGDAEFAKAVCDSLIDGGRFAIDTWLSEGLLPVFQSSGVWTVADTWIAEERHYDMESARIDSRWSVEVRGSMERFSTSIRLYTWREIKALLLNAGFRSVEHLSAQGEAFALKSTGCRSHIVATK